MDRLDVDALVDENQMNNKSLTGPEHRQFDPHGNGQDMHGAMSHGNRDISHG